LILLGGRGKYGDDYAAGGAGKFLGSVIHCMLRFYVEEETKTIV
jgi:hypothetical protein